MSERPDGYWTTEAPLTQEQVDEDMGSIRGIVIPANVKVQEAEVYVNGRLWHWERLGVAFRDVRREAEDPR